MRSGLRPGRELALEAIYARRIREGSTCIAGLFHDAQASGSGRAENSPSKRFT